jgi:hypothetical protein
MANLDHYYTLDWKIKAKGGILPLVSDRINEGTVTPEDFETAEQVCNDIKYLISFSEIIPDDVKEVMMEDIMAIKQEFIRVKLTWFAMWSKQ